jgi:hypothetical protein
MNDLPDAQPPPVVDLQALALSQAEARALFDGIRARAAPTPIATGLLGLSVRTTRQCALLGAAAALAQVALIAILPGLRPREPLEHAFGATLLEGRPLTPRDVYLFHLWGKP